MVDSGELKKEIRKSGLTQVELAQKIGMNPATLNGKINNKKGKLSVDEAQKIVCELNLTFENAARIFFAKNIAYPQRKKAR